jgi:excisionase family DNA binding protein
LYPAYKRYRNARDHLAALAAALPADAVASVPVAWLHELLGDALAAPPVQMPANGRGHDVEDRQLTIAEAAQRLGVTEDWLYHRWKTLPLGATKLSRRTLRFSAVRVERYLEARQRGAAAS